MAYFPQLLFAFAFVNVALCDDILDFLSTDEMEMGKELFEFCANQTNAQREIVKEMGEDMMKGKHEWEEEKKTQENKCFFNCVLDTSLAYEKGGKVTGDKLQEKHPKLQDEDRDKIVACYEQAKVNYSAEEQKCDRGFDFFTCVGKENITSKYATTPVSAK